MNDMKSLVCWARQPTSIAGFATILGTFAGLLNQQVTSKQAIPLFIGAIVSIVIPDNTRTQLGAETSGADIVKASAGAKS